MDGRSVRRTASRAGLRFEVNFVWSCDATATKVVALQAEATAMSLLLPPSVVDIRSADREHPRLVIVVSPLIEPDHGMRLQRMDEVGALSGYLSSRLLADGFWPKSEDITVALGEPQSPVADEGFFSVTLSNYSPTWSSRQFENAVCVAARRFLRVVAPRAPAGRYLADFERRGRVFSVSFLARSKTGVVAEVGCALTRSRFKARLSVTAENGRASEFEILQSGACPSEWSQLLGKLRVSRTQVAVEAVPRSMVRIVRKGRAPIAQSTGERGSLERFVVRLTPLRPIIVRQFELHPPKKRRARR